MGKQIADFVLALTNEPDRPFERIALYRESRLVKLADRIANVEESLANLFEGQPTKIEKYYREWPAFKKYIKRPGEAEAMWVHLERLLTDQGYARRFILSHASH